MSSTRQSVHIKRVRNECLIALNVIYPSALRADQLARTLVGLFPTLEFEHLKRDLHYLVEKGYVARVVTEEEAETPEGTPWRNRWFRLTTAGLELAQQCASDPALEMRKP